MNTYPEKEKIAVVNRYLNGETISKISQSTKISRTTIYLWVKKRNNSFNKGKAPNFRYLHDLQEKCDRQQKIIEILQRSPCTPSAPLSKRYEVIKSLSDEYTVNILCEALKVAKGSYYNHILRNKNGNTKAANRKAEMLPVIEQIFHDYNEIFGSSKIYAILKDRGYAISESTVAKIMHENGMFSIRACAKTLYKQHQERKANILQQQFHVSHPNEVWVSDVTYFSVFGRMYYICVVLDLYARKVIAYKISRHNSTQLTKATVKAAYETRKPTEILLFHSDQGSNYTSNEFRKYLKSLNIIQSFSNPGMPYDNSVMESFFGSFKREALYRYRFKTEKDFFEGVAIYIHFYNDKRPHSVLMNQTPDKYEANFFNKYKENSKPQTEQ